MVPLDGTAFAEAAVRPAAELAARAGAVLHLVGIMTDTAGALLPTDPVDNTGLEQVVQRTREREELLREVCARVRAEWGCQTSFELLSDVSTSDAIADSARRLDADLVVAATHVRGWLSRSILGSTGEDLLREGPFAVLLIPTQEPEPTEGTPMQGAVTSIVAAMEPDADPGDCVLAHAAHWAQLWKARLTLVEVVVEIPLAPPGPEALGPIAAIQPPMPERETGPARERLRAICDSLRAEGIDAIPHVVKGEGPAEALLDYVQSSDADLLVVGRHDKGMWERFIEGSESTKLAHRIRNAGLLVCHESEK